MKEIIFSLILFLFSCSSILAQDVPTSLGPAPNSTFKITEEPTPFLQVGTRYFSQISVGGTTFQFGKAFLESCTITNIGSPFAITFPGGLLYYNGKVYTYNQSSPFQLYLIDTVSGTHTLQFNMTGVPQANLTGLYYDGTTVYGVSSSLSVSQIFSVNMTTGVCTPIGSPSATCAGAIFLTGRLGAQYSAFSVDIVLDNLYKWNKTTGVATLVGPIGGNANFGQDACFDNNDNKLYWMSYTTGPQLRTIDTATGTAGTVLCSYTAQATGIVCLPPGGGPSPLAQPDQWCSNFPPVSGSGELWGHASCTLGDTLYVAGGGAAAAASTTFYKYSIHGNSWSTGTPLPGAKTGGDLVSCGGKLYYVGGGASITTGNGSTYSYNPANGTWTTLANQPTAVTGCVGESYQDSIIYCMMGGWSTYSTSIQVYRPSSNTWTTATAFTGNGRRSFSGGISGNKLFVACGYNGTYLNTFYTGTINPSNPLQITWVAGPNSRWTASRSGGTAIAGRFYVCPGDTGTGVASGGIGVWDTTTNTWTYYYGDPFLGSNYWGAMSSSMVNCSGKLGIKVWRVAGSLSATTRPLIVFADTCLTGCDVVTGLPKVSGPIIPTEFMLMQNYPNPFNPVTKITYAIPKADDVKLTVYDLLGRRVAILVNDFKRPGLYSIDFDGTNLASGVYFYRLESGNFTGSKKMLLIK